MTIEKRKLHPHELPSLTETCIWFLKGKESTPAFTQLDWNMCGSLSRALKQKLGSEARSLIPTLKRIPSQFVMLDSIFDEKEFTKTCVGMKFETVAIVCENEKRSIEIAEELSHQKGLEYPKFIIVFVEESVEP